MASGYSVPQYEPASVETVFGPYASDYHGGCSHDLGRMISDRDAYYGEHSYVANDPRSSHEGGSGLFLRSGSSLYDGGFPELLGQ